MNPDGVFQETISAYETIDYKEKYQQLEKGLTQQKQFTDTNARIALRFKEENSELEKELVKQKVTLDNSKIIIGTAYEEITTLKGQLDNYQKIKAADIKILDSLIMHLGNAHSIALKEIVRLNAQLANQKYLDRQEVEKIFKTEWLSGDAFGGTLEKLLKMMISLLPVKNKPNENEIIGQFITAICNLAINEEDKKELEEYRKQRNFELQRSIYKKY